MRGVGLAMKLRELLDSDQLILVVCDECRAKTPVDPAPPALEHGVNADVSDLRSNLNCPICGSADVTLQAYSPLATQRAAVSGRASERA